MSDIEWDEGGVADGDPISIVIFSVMFLLMIDWLTTVGISPLPSYAQSSPVLGAIYPSFKWLLIAVIPITVLLIAQWAISGGAEIPPTDKITTIVYVAREKVKAKTSIIKEKRNAYKA